MTACVTRHIASALAGVWQEPIEPLVAATLKAIEQQMPEPWKLLRVEKSGVMSRCTLMCYEPIEFEPTPPAALLQFDPIRRVLKQESRFAGTARGVFGNGQQPIWDY